MPKGALQIYWGSKWSKLFVQNADEYFHIFFPYWWHQNKITDLTVPRKNYPFGNDFQNNSIHDFSLYQMFDYFCGEFIWKIKQYLKLAIS